jgi:hypothetical protein
MPLHGLLREHEVAIDHDLEGATPRGEDDQLRDLVFELFQQAFRQTDGSR